MGLIQLHGLVAGQTQQRPQPPKHQLLPCGTLGALISPFPSVTTLDDLTAEELAAWAAHHNDVLLAYCADDPVLPMAMGAVFSNETAVQTKVRENIDTHLRALHQLDGIQEFTVQLNATSGPLPTALKPNTGRDFLMARRKHRDRRQNLSNDQTSMANDILAWLRSNSMQLTPAGRSKSGRILDCVVLISKGLVSDLQQMARDLHAPAAAISMDLIISGPWPPYSFDPSGARALENRDVH